MVSGHRPFTERLKRVLAATRTEAVVQGRQSIETEHMLAALCREPDGVAAAVLANLGVRASELGTAAIGVAPHGAIESSPSALQYGSRAKSVLELAMKESAALHHDWLGPEHLLLGLSAEGEGAASGVLAGFGVTAERVRAEIVKLVDPSDRPGA